MLLSESLRNSGRQHTKESGLEWTPQSTTWSLQVSTGRLNCAAFARHCFALGGGSHCSSQYLCRDHDAVGTRLAVCVRVRLCARTQSERVCVGVPSARSLVQTRLPRHCSPNRGYTHRRVRSSLGSAVSLSPRICRRTTPRLFGCHSLIPQPSSWFRQPTPFHVPGPLSH